MITFENDYNVLLRQAKVSIKQNELDLEPEELISNVYVKLFNSPDYTYDYFSFQKEIFATSKHFNSHKPDFIPYNDKWKKSQQHINYRGERVCKDCKEVKPVSQFELTTNEVGKIFQRLICKECRLIRVKEYREKNKKEIAERAIGRIKANHGSYIKRKRRDNKKRSDALTDSYIKMTLWSRFSKEYLKNNPEIIELTRQRILKKRRKRLVKKVSDFRGESGKRIKLKKQKPPKLVNKIKKTKMVIIKKTKFDYAELYKKLPSSEPKINPVAFSTYQNFCHIVNEKINQINVA